MTIEELLKPRYKVIADYTDSMFSVGGIIIEDWQDADLWYCRDYKNEEYWFPKNDVIENFPHLFKKLEWWEERDFDLSGMFVRFGALDKQHAYYKLIKPSDYRYGFWEMGGNYTYPLHESFPATEQEYDNYIKSKTTT